MSWISCCSRSIGNAAKWPGCPESRVVHEQVDRALRIGESGFDAGERDGIGEVGGQHLGAGAVRVAELLGQRLEAGRVPCDEHEVVTTVGEREREGVPDS